MKRQGISKSTHQAIVEVLQHRCSSLPDEVREMLLAAVPWSLCVPADKRRGDQAEAVSMIASVVEAVRTRLQDAVQEEVANIAKLTSGRAAFEASIQPAEAAHNEARRAVEDCKAQLQAVSEALAGRKAAVKDAEAEEQRLR